jgi:hypothetical protein
MSENNEATALADEARRVAEAARDAVTDEMVSRLADTAGGAIELIDQVNRSGLGKAIPTLAQMVGNGDLERLVQLARVYGSAEDALSDEMVGRLSEAIGGGLSLLDQINRSGLEKALPVLSRMAADGDFERIAALARVYHSAEDALSDEMVGRIAETIGEGMSLLDRMTRGGAGRVVEMMEHMEATGALERAVTTLPKQLERIAATLPKLAERMDHLEHLLASMEAAAEDARNAPPPKGGFLAMWQLMSDPETQRTLQFMLRVGQRMRERR